MSKYQQKEGDIAIFLRKDKKGEKHPDWTGTALIDGKKKDVSLWIKSDTMLAGSIKDAWVPDFDKAKPSTHDAQKANGYQNDDMSDEIPF